jgi:hypothetical protein
MSYKDAIRRRAARAARERKPGQILHPSERAGAWNFLGGSKGFQLPSHVEGATPSRPRSILVK